MVRFTLPENDTEHSFEEDDIFDHNSILCNYNHRTSDEQVEREEFNQFNSLRRNNNNITYAAYYPPQYPEARLPLRISYKRQLFIFLLILTFRHYLPPPPPPHNSWNTFVAESTENLTTAVLSISMLVWYLVSGCLSNIYNDALYWSRNISFLRIENKSSVCNISLFRSGNQEESTIEQFLLDSIVGQNDAIRFISKAVNDWKTLAQLETTNHISEQKPLSMLFTGSEGVGKRETAKQIASLIFQNCTETDFCRHNSCVENNAVLELNDTDFAFFSEGQLTTKILEYIYTRKGSGAVIILNHIEQLPLSVLKELAHLMKKSSVTFKRPEAEGRYDRFNIALQDSRDKEAEVSLGNTVFIFTTDRGAQIAFELVRKYRRSFKSLPWNELQEQVKDDIHSSFSGPFASHVVPFWPLQASDLDTIMTIKIARLSERHEKSKWKSLQLTETARRHCIGPDAVKYIKYGSSNEDVDIVFAGKGAHQLDDIIATIKEKIALLPFTNPTDILLVKSTLNDIFLEFCDKDECTE